MELQELRTICRELAYHPRIQWKSARIEPGHLANLDLHFRKTCKDRVRDMSGLGRNLGEVGLGKVLLK